MSAIDFKKTQKEFYQPGVIPSIIDVPEMTFIMVDGSGDPNTSNALEILYGLSYSIKMSKMAHNWTDIMSMSCRRLRVCGGIRTVAVYRTCPTKTAFAGRP